ncbi:TRAP transporter large permease [Aquabacter sp. CN5-332]|uniref:TRAP transporter large permease n=1 Tax=Aquabacter sp. CN5-332 TaxID=3156608 RepID=UPI0032B5E1F8
MIGALILVALIFFLVIGLPLAFGMALASVIGLFLLDGNLIIMAMQIFEGLKSFPLVAIPLFLLMANLMEVGGVTDSLVRFATSLIGHVRGSLAIGNVTASTLFSGISGSCMADTTAVGSMLIPAMVREGYPPAFAGAVTAAANIVGPIIPPSILMILYGFAAEQSIAELFLAGILPGLLLSLIFGLYAFWVSSKKGYGSMGHRFSLKAVAVATVRATPALVIPVLIVFGVTGGVFTLTESAGAAALYALLYALFRGALQGGVDWRGIGRAFFRAGIDTGVVMILVGASDFLSWVLTRSEMPEAILSVLSGYSPMVTLLLINIVLLIFGTFLEPAPALLLASALFLPLVKSLGIDLVHFGIIMIVNLQLGVLTPPVASAAFITSRIAGISFEKQVRALLPFVGLGVIALLIITYVPAVSLWVPSLFAAP